MSIWREYDAMVAWMELQGNFVRVRADLSQGKSRVWREMAAYVNRQEPEAKWTGERAFWRLGECVKQYLKTKNAADAGLTVDHLDLQGGVYTIEQKLERKCRHFYRLQELYDGDVNRFTSTGLSEAEQREEESREILDLEETSEKEQAKQVDSIVLDSDDEKNKEPKEEQESATKPVVLSLLSDEEEEEDEAFPLQTGMKRPAAEVRRSPVRAKKTTREEDGGSSWLRRKLRRVAVPSESAQRSSFDEPRRQRTADDVLASKDLKKAAAAGANVSEDKSSRKQTPASEPRRPAKTDKADSREKINAAAARVSVDGAAAQKQVPVPESSDSDTPLARTTSFRLVRQKSPRRTPTRTPLVWSSGNASKEKQGQGAIPILKPTHSPRAGISTEVRTPAAAVSMTTAQEHVDELEEKRQSSRAEVNTSMQSGNTNNSANTKSGATQEVPRESNSMLDPSLASESEMLAIQSAEAAGTSTSSAAPQHDKTIHPTDPTNRVEKTPSNGKLSRPDIAAQSTANESVAENPAQPRNVESPAGTKTTPKNGTSSQKRQEPPSRAKRSPHSQAQSPAVSDVLRSAIAQVVSQRQQLLNSRTSAASHVSHVRTRLGGLTTESGGDSAESVKEGLPVSHCDGVQQDNQHEGILRGFEPPLFTSPPTDQNLDRKLTYLRAKQLAFDQMRWRTENELQKREVALLRREMEAREMLAHKELELKQLRIRAELMLPMILSGASPAEIAERLEML